MSKHTEGPWQSVSIDHDPYTIIGGIDGPDDGRMHFTEVCIVNEEAADAEANRRLIIAAPDLLKVLQQVEREMQAGFGSSFGETREQVRRALAMIEARKP